MSNAPTKKKVRKKGVTMMGTCDYAMPNVCIANPKGPVDAYYVVDDKRQINVCMKCFEQQILSGQWVQDHSGAAADDDA